MAYTPVNGLEINVNIIPSGVYTPVNGLEINVNITGDVPVFRRAIVLNAGLLCQISDAEIGTGRKPVKTLRGETLVITTGGMRTLGSDETLLV